MGKRTKDRLEASLMALLAHMVEPAPDWRETQTLASRFIDELQEHMEDEFLRRAATSGDEPTSHQGGSNGD